MESKGPRDFVGGRDDDEDDEDDDKPNQHKTRGGPSGGGSRRGGGGGGGGAGPSGGNSGSGDAPHGSGPYDGDENSSGPSSHPGGSGSGSRGDDKSSKWQQDGAGTTRKRGNVSRSSSSSTPDDDEDDDKDDEDTAENEESSRTSRSPSWSKDSSPGDAKERLRTAMLAKSRRSSPTKSNSKAGSSSKPRGRNTKTKQALVKEDEGSGQPSMSKPKAVPSVLSPGHLAAFPTSGPLLAGPSSRPDSLGAPMMSRQHTDGLVRRHPKVLEPAFAGPPGAPVDHLSRTNSMGMLSSAGANSAPVSYSNTPYSSDPSTPAEGGAWIPADAGSLQVFNAEGPPELRRNSFSQTPNVVPYGAHDGRPNTTGVLMDRNVSMQSMQGQPHPAFARMVPSGPSMMAGFGVGQGGGGSSSSMGNQILQGGGEMPAMEVQRRMQMQDHQQQQLAMSNGQMQGQDQAFYAPFAPNAQGMITTAGSGPMSQGMSTLPSTHSRSGSVSSTSRPGTDDYNSVASAPSACETPLFGPSGIPPGMGPSSQAMAGGDSLQPKMQGSEGNAGALNDWFSQAMLPTVASSGGSGEVNTGLAPGLDVDIGLGKLTEGGPVTTMTSAGPTSGSQLMQAGLHSFSPPRTLDAAMPLSGSGGNGSKDVFGGGFAGC